MGNVYPDLINPTDPRNNPSLSSNVYWLENGARDVYNVKNFGARGDDSTDDYAAITAAIAAMPTTSAEPAGSILYFPNGSYRISAGLVINNKVCCVYGVAKSYTAPQSSQASGQAGLVLAGSKLVGMTPGITLLTISESSGGGAGTKHAGPEVDLLGFEDGTYISYQANVSSIAWSAGTATFTMAGQHPFQVGQTVYMDKATDTGASVWNSGTSYSVGQRVFYPASNSTWICIASSTGDQPNLSPSKWVSPNAVYTVTAVTSTTWQAVAPQGIDAVTGGKVAIEDITGSLTMTGLTIAGITRSRVGRCTFGLLNVGLSLDPSTGDTSWGTYEYNDFICDNIGFYLTGSGAQSAQIIGGSYLIGSKQTAIRGDNPSTQSRISNMKIDMGEGTSCDSTIGIDLQKASNFEIGPVSFENDVDPLAATAAIGIRIGHLAASFGDIVSMHMQGSRAGGTANVIGVELNGSGSSDPVVGVNILGGTYNSLKTAIHLGQYCRNVNLLGGVTEASDNGLVVDSGATEINLIGFQHAKNNTPYTHISDPGGGIVVQIGCHQHEIGLLDGIKVAGRSVQYALATLLSTVDVTAAGDSAVLSYTIPANTLAVGQVYHFRLLGDMDSPTVPVGQGVKWKVAGNGAMVINSAPTASQTNEGIIAEGTMTVRSIASGTATLWNSLWVSSGGYTAANRTKAKSQTSSFTTAVSSTCVLEVDFNIGASPPAGTHMRAYECVIERTA